MLPCRCLLLRLLVQQLRLLLRLLLLVQQLLLLLHQLLQQLLLLQGHGKGQGQGAIGGAQLLQPLPVLLLLEGELPQRGREGQGQ